MEIVFLANAASVHTVKWVNALADRGHIVHLIYKGDDMPTENTINKEVICHSLQYTGIKGYFFNAPQLKKICRSIQPDLINAHYASGYGMLARLAKLKPLLLSVWGSDVYDFPYQSALKMQMLKKNLRFADAVSSSSYAMKKQVQKLIGEEKEIHVIPFGIDTQLFSRRQNNINRENFVIGNIKSLQPVYAIDDLLRAFHYLCTKLESEGYFEVVQKLQLKIYGDGEEKENLLALAKSLQIEDKTFFMGKIPNSSVPAALEDIDIFCATSLQESFGVALLEAMAMEVPVVATNTEGFAEIIESGKDGIIVAAEDIEAIANALATLISDKRMRTKFGNEGRKKVLQCYDFCKNVEDMIKLYGKMSNDNF
ncbi:MAG: glycosyltransferase family 4 protein [Eubacteriaceae bacterium]|jgi:glycosyltransferase involved in cell wall biosynthesis|nr:glycosyltransferase family 4 protein [Eubacteriaceae bacterium]